MLSTTKSFNRRLIRMLGDIGIYLSKWGDWEGLEKASQRPRYFNIENWRIEYKPAGSVLDVGCGSGILLDRIHKSSSMKIRYCGIDRSRGAIKLAKTKILDEKYEIFFRTNINNDPKIHGDNYDVIIFNEVLYYLDDPIAVVEKYIRHLNDGGIFIVSVLKKSQANSDNNWDRTWQIVHSTYEDRCIQAVFIHGNENYGWHQGLYAGNKS